MPNVENIKRVIELVRKTPEEHFDMSMWFEIDETGVRAQDIEEMSISEALTRCGTTACLAGFCVAAALPDAKLSEIDFFLWEYHDPSTKAISPLEFGMSFLGITFSQAQELFTEFPSEKVDREVAIECLENLIESGTVNWNLAIRQVRGE